MNEIPFIILIAERMLLKYNHNNKLNSDNNNRQELTFQEVWKMLCTTFAIRIVSFVLFYVFAGYTVVVQIIEIGSEILLSFSGVAKDIFVRDGVKR